jgi:hypothetical protein
VYAWDASSNLVGEAGTDDPSTSRSGDAYAAFQSALDELNRVVASQARLVGDWTVAQMMAAYNQFHASDDPVVRAAMDQIARQAFYGVTDYKYQQKVQVALYEQAVEASRRQQALQIQAQATADRDYYRAVAGMSADPLAEPVQRSFLQNTLDFVDGANDAVWDMAVGMYDISGFSMVVTPDRYDSARDEMLSGFMYGVDENGLWAQANIAFNPVYHVLDGGASLGDALATGDYHGAGGATVATGVALLEVAAVAIPGAQLVVGLGTKVITALGTAAARDALALTAESASVDALTLEGISVGSATKTATNFGAYFDGTSVAEVEIATTLRTAPDQAVFFSGLGRAGDEIAATWASDSGGVTLSELLASDGRVLPIYDRLNPESVAAWTNASIDMATRASGDVRVLLGDSVSPTSIWSQYELPFLKANPNVRSITALDPVTGSEVVLWVRP